MVQVQVLARAYPTHNTGLSFLARVRTTDWYTHDRMDS